MLNSVNNDLNSSSLDNKIGINGVVTNPINNPYKNIDKSLLIDETAISDQAVNMYQKEQDINQFNQLAMSDPEDLSHEDIIAGLFNNGASDPLSDEMAAGLSSNPKLLEDLGL
jgi:hypothetical protein